MKKALSILAHHIATAKIGFESFNVWQGLKTTASDSLSCGGLIIIIILLAFQTKAQDSLQNKRLSASQLQEDFRLYRKVLEETHPGLYRYNSEAEMTSKLDSIEQLLNQPMPFYEFNKMLMALNADLRCAHSAVTPTKRLENYMNSQIKSFPLYCFPIDRKQYVIFNGTENNRIKLGDEILQINGLKTDSIFRVIERHSWKDGYSKIENSRILQGTLFSMFYYLVISQPTTFEIQLKNTEGEIFSVKLPAQEFSVTQKNFNKNPINKKALEMYGKAKNKKNWYVEILKDVNSTAFLRFSGFGDPKANSTEEAQRIFREFMEKMMRKLEKKAISNLIIDVRDNSGGWDIMGAELLSYLVKSTDSIQYYKRLHTITNNSEFLKYADLSEADLKQVKSELRLEADSTFTLIDENTQMTSRLAPKPNAFKGEIYILMNVASQSTTSEFLALAKTYKVGTLIGEEAGGAYEGGNGGSFLDFSLPNSKIRIHLPLVYYENAVSPSELKGRGTMPDIEVYFQPEDLLNGFDRRKEFAKDLIRKGK